MRPKGRKEISVLLNVLPDDINVGYHHYLYQVIDKVNGQPIDSFQDLVMKLDRGSEQFTIIQTERFGTILLDREKMKEANARILEKYRIPAQFSKDVAEWLAKAVSQ